MTTMKLFSSVATRPSSNRRICIILVLSLLLLMAYKESFAPVAPTRDSDAPVAGGYDPYDGSFVPEGPAVALPSILISAEEDSKINRHIYGGKGDKAHLGGFTAFDEMGVGVTLWKHMVKHLGIKSVLDLGCGRGTSTSWFVTHGLEYVVCAEGSHDAVTQSLLPKIPPSYIPNGTQFEIVEHDFSRGPWWPSRTVVSLMYVRAMFSIVCHPFAALCRYSFDPIICEPILDQDAVWCVEVRSKGKS